MLRSQLVPGDVFVREYGGRVCAMPAPGVSVAVEVWTREEPWLEAFRRMVEHLECGVTIVLFLSERHRSIYVYRDDVGPCRFEPDAALQVPDVLPGFSVPVAALFA